MLREDEARDGTFLGTWDAWGEWAGMAAGLLRPWREGEAGSGTRAWP